MLNIINLAVFEHLTNGQTVLPNSSVLIGQQLVENADIEKWKRYILGNFQTCDVAK